MWPRKKPCHELENEIEMRRKVNDGLLERIWAKLEEARSVPEAHGEGLEELENDDEPEEDP